MKIIIIAEAGVNHNGDLSMAKRLIDAGAEAGVDYVKFQTFKANKLVSKEAIKADYQNKNTKNENETQLEMLQKLELSEEDHYELIKHCKSRGVKFLSTAFDLDSIDFLKKIGITLFKIPSGELTNLPYLEKITEVADEVILSTGMSTMEEIEESISVLRKRPGLKVTVLHCNTAYPTPYHDVNLLAMLTIQKKLNVDIGYSDHTLGIEVPIAAAALRASVIEKHFTLDRAMDGPDHAASIEPDELIAMVQAIRNVELALGSADKKPSSSELKNISIARKSIHLKGAVKKGTVIELEHLQMLRPGDGISPMRVNELFGRIVNKDLDAGSKLTYDDLN